MEIVTTFIICLGCFRSIRASSIGKPVYPITASLFLDRTEVSEWNNTLDQFQKQDGDTVWLEAPPLVRRSKEDLQKDPVFKWCKEYDKDTAKEVDCFTHAQQELANQGLNIISFASYQYEEDFSKVIVKCPKYDKRITTVYTYFRIVLPGKHDSGSCEFNGMDVVVLFTSFSGPDAQEILLESASVRNISVYFGVPRLPRSWEFGNIDKELLPAYFEWVRRVMGDHKSRYSNKTMELYSLYSVVPSKPIRIPLYKTLKGYYISDDVNMGTVDRYGDMLMIYASLVSIAKLEVCKSLKLAIAPSIDMTTFDQNRTVKDHVTGFGYLVETYVDVIAVHEGRGYGKASYYWPTQANQPVKNLDPTLDKILQRINPSWKENGTFKEWFTGSVYELFQALGNKTAELKKRHKTLELWLGVEAFDDLNDDPCIPLTSYSKNSVMDNVNKRRLDFALSQGAAKVQKVIAFSWDPDFTCTTKRHNVTLSDGIIQDAKRPVIFECRFHSPQNASVVMIGINIMGSGFHIDWADKDGQRHQDTAYGCYIEGDYGHYHPLIPSLEYVQACDPWDDSQLSDNGYVKVQALEGYQECIFEYDFSDVLNN
ncbi:uncharacterized protein LOC133185900 [Saccostrea echinata]|uniref:uncharacterized protein LOC133185900 n=1 Tax=Saccostrea echinata TaxID=191078 RepID=UPI002A8417CE|nr:uncharacterized protein LOC133185900 [Saccostrea echinata]